MSNPVYMLVVSFGANLVIPELTNSSQDERERNIKPGKAAPRKKKVVLRVLVRTATKKLHILLASKNNWISRYKKKNGDKGKMERDTFPSCNSPAVCAIIYILLTRQ